MIDPIPPVVVGALAVREYRERLKASRARDEPIDLVLDDIRAEAFASGFRAGWRALAERVNKGEGV